MNFVEVKAQFDPPGDKRRKRVALVGFSQTTMQQAPFGDVSWEIWGMNQLYRFLPRISRWFEIHADYVFDQASGTDYRAWLKTCPVPVYMCTKDADIPNGVAYPVERMIAEFDLGSMRPQDKNAAEKGYFHSSVDFMIALAISEGFEEIGIWGIDMSHDTEYVLQKPSGSFWLGLAKGRGIKVYVPSSSALLNSQGYRYGYDREPVNETITQLKHRATSLGGRKEQLTNELKVLEGQLAEIHHWTEFQKAISRGSATY